MKTFLYFAFAPVAVAFGLSGCTTTQPVAERLAVYEPSPVGERVPLGGTEVVFRTVGYRPGFVDPYYTGNTYRDRTLFGAPWNRQVRLLRTTNRTVIVRE
ncbi:MAG TPA: hypothetical protein VNQ90_09745 [Chthoniobacteraceae bacterium]|nr:hypothetical protein [Chthoniobacteraceae bacterium]